MLNQVNFVGRVKSIERVDKDVFFILEVERSFKDIRGEFKSDYVRCKAWRGAEQRVNLSIQEGYLVSVAGKFTCKEGQQEYYIDSYEIETVGIRR